MDANTIQVWQQRILETWNNLTRTQRIVTSILLAAGVVLVGFFALWVRSPDYAVLLSGLSEQDAAAVVESLKKNNVPYQLDDTSSVVLVPASRVAEVRLSLAKEGLPKGGEVGFELFDTTNLAMTDFTQKVNYQRALEGELARTIDSIDSVQKSRVHIVIPQPSLYSQEENTTTASILLDLKPGRTLNNAQIAGVTHLVSGSVEGLKPENLTIIDTHGNVLNGSSAGNGSSGTSLDLSTSQMEQQRQVEEQIRRKVQAMLNQVEGPNNTVVRVAAVINWDQKEIDSEEYITPTNSSGVLRSAQQSQEIYNGNAADQAGGIPGTASNVPGAAPSYQTTSGVTGTTSYQKTDSTLNYEVSKVVTHHVLAPGQIKKLSVSVLVDQITDTQHLQAVRDAVAAAAGIDSARGDELVVQSVSFDRTFLKEQNKAMKDAERMALYFSIARWVALALGLIVMFLFMRGAFQGLGYRPIIETSELVLAEGDAGAGAGAVAALSAAAPPDQQVDEEGIALPEKAALPDLEFPEDTPEQAVFRHIQVMAKAQPDALARVVKFWLDEEEG
ncbi:MAG: flagellar M-ring protein FliF [Chloroflexi bacterium]|nr:flagellar M-ring protein FliF [Chloroflexota bacterium]